MYVLPFCAPHSLCPDTYSVTNINNRTSKTAMVSKQAIFQCAALTHPLLVFCRCSSSINNGSILKRNEMFTLVLLNVRNGNITKKDS